MTQVLSSEFLAKYQDIPDHMTPLGLFVFLRTYARYMNHENRRETYKETCARATQYNVNLSIEHLKSVGFPVDYNKMTAEAELLFDNMFNMRQFLSGRTLAIGGTAASKRSSLSNFNCSALNISKWEDLCDLFYLLMVGTGVGFKCNKQLISGMGKIRSNVTIEHSDYHPLPKNERLEHTKQIVLENGYAKIYIGDSKEGWVQGLRYFLNILTEPDYSHIHSIKISYNSVRPRGERLKTFGGTSSGPDPLRDMFGGIDKILKNTLDPWIDPMVSDSNGWVTPRPIHIMDIGNLIGQNVVVGGVRRTAEMFIFEPNEYEVLFAKYGLNGFYKREEIDHHIHLGKELEKLGIKPKWFDKLTEMFETTGQASRAGLFHRHLSNNSIMFPQKPSIEYLRLLFQILRYEGEPGLLNMEEMNRRRPNAELVNPCVSADTVVMTSEGPKLVKDLIGKQFNAVVEGQVAPSTIEGFFKTGTQQLFKLKTKNGYSLRLTKEHKVLVREFGGKQVFVPACELSQGSDIILNNVGRYGQWRAVTSDEMYEDTEHAKGFLLGNLLSCGYFTTDADGTYACVSTKKTTGMRKYCNSLIILGYRYYPTDDRNIISSQLATLAFTFGINSNNTIDETFSLLTASSYLQRGFIEGLCESVNSFVVGNSTRIICSQSYQNLEMSQIMLANMGIKSEIHDVKGCCIVLCFSESNFTRNIGIHMECDKFESLTPDLTEDVYDCTIDNIHMFSANGILVHNCGEILLDTYQTCNLTTVNLTRFVIDGENGPYLDTDKLYEAQRLSTRAGIRMTLVTLELPQWDEKQKRDRLIGTSLTGIKDTMDRLNYTTEQEHQVIKQLGDIARQEAVVYAKEMRIATPLLATTIKPEGTLSQVAGGVSQGLHLSHSPYYIRRIRINANDPLVEVIKRANWTIHPEAGTQGNTLEEKMANARTLVVDFPVSSYAKKTKYQSNIHEQLETYFTYQKIYADHNCSNTITVKDNEWDKLPQIIYDNWDRYIGVSFIPLDGGNYELAPYEECTEEEYHKLKASMSPLDSQLLNFYDRKAYGSISGSDEESTIIELDDTSKSECSGGVCPIR